MRSRLSHIILASAAIFAAHTPATLGATASPSVADPAPQSDDTYKKIVDTAGEALVTIKFVLKSPDDQGFGDDEQEINGVIIDAKGTILCSYWPLGGAFKMFGQGGAAPKPQDLKVLIGDDTEGKKARLLTHDTELDLAWIKLDDEPASPLKFIDLDKSADGAMGDRIFLLTRMDKYFDRAEIINEARIRGVTTRPRRLYSPGVGLLADISSDLGMPVFNADAGFLGVVIVQIPDKEAMAAAQNMGGGPMILPAEAVAKATKRALEAVQSGEKKDEAEAATDAPKTEPEAKKD